MKRHRTIVRWRLKSEDDWLRWVVVLPSGGMVRVNDKESAIQWAALDCRRAWEEHGLLGQLVVKTKRGTISFERTYGRDPRRYKG